MSADKNHIKQFSAEDISRYWQGKLSPQEMHQLEMAAMDDPFLADALEGYATIPPAQVTADLAELRERLKDRDQEKAAPMPSRNTWWRVAAAVILLAGAGMLAYTLLQQNNALSPANEMAQKTSTQEKAAATNTSIDTSDQAKDAQGSDRKLPLTDTGTADVLTAIKPEELQGQKPVATNIPDLVKEQKDAPPLLAPPAASKTNATTDSNSANLARNKRELEAQKKLQHDSVFMAQATADNSDAYRNQRAQENVVTNNRSRNQPLNNAMSEEYPSINNYSGRVIDQRNNAIPFATVKANNTQVAATDADGFFRIKSADTVLDLSVASVGYESRQLTLRGNTPPQDVVLESQQGKLKEVVVSGYGTQRKKTVTGSVSKVPSETLKIYEMNAEPVNGWTAYNEYLQKNKRTTLPDDKASDATGEVIVLFNVGRRGQLSDFTIEKSLGKSQDAEAMRLIKEGPAWKLTKGKKSKARVVVTF
jgi:hypothetical protein